MLRGIASIVIVALAASLADAGPLGIFGARNASGSCGSGQCTVPAQTATVTVIPTGTGRGQAHASLPASANACFNGKTVVKFHPVRRFFQRFRR